jgi:hypothetical protein
VEDRGIGNEIERHALVQSVFDGARQLETHSDVEQQSLIVSRRLEVAQLRRLRGQTPATGRTEQQARDHPAGQQ